MNNKQNEETFNASVSDFKNYKNQTVNDEMKMNDDPEIKQQLEDNHLKKVNQENDVDNLPVIKDKKENENNKNNQNQENENDLPVIKERKEKSSKTKISSKITENINIQEIHPKHDTIPKNTYHNNENRPRDFGRSKRAHLSKKKTKREPGAERLKIKKNSKRISDTNDNPNYNIKTQSRKSRRKSERSKSD